MLTRDHRFLGYYVLEIQDARLDPACKKMFLLGCVEPDWNLLTYARGSLKHKFLHGHNAENVAQHLEHLIETTKSTGVRTPMQWFRLGAALHYLADSFTFAHNRDFSGSLLDHRDYELNLHSQMRSWLQSQRAELLVPNKACHEKYLADCRSYQTDCRYIIGSMLGLCSMLPVEWCSESFTLEGKAQGCYGKV